MGAVAAFLVLVLVAFRRGKGPVWALALAWLFCLAPLVFGWMNYGFFDVHDRGYALTLIVLLGAYVAGAAAWTAMPRAPLLPPEEAAAAADFRVAYVAARVAWWVGIAGVICVVGDFLQNGEAGLDDLSALRGAYTARTGASLLAQIGSVLTWGCLYCFTVGLAFRARLGRGAYLRLVAPIAGYFLLSVLSAGRQAAFQIMMVTALSLAITRARRELGPAGVRSKGGLTAATVIAALMIGYMGYVAIARNDNTIDTDKGQVILVLFDAELSPGAEAALSAAGPGVRAGAIEGMAYFSSSIALFQKFLLIHFPRPTYGAMTFPFVFRQLQGVTGQQTGMLLDDKEARLAQTGVIGAGWTTAISAFLEDFGFAGTCLFLFLAGYLSQGAWARARVSGDPNMVVLAMAGLLFAIYTPLIPAVSDTNILLLMLFPGGLILLRHDRLRRRLAAA